MKTYLKYKRDIQGFGNVATTVKTAQKIAASYIHFLKQEVGAARIYLQNVETALTRLFQFYSNFQSPFLRHNHGQKRLLVVISGDQGLAGGLFHNLVNYFLTQNKKYDYYLILGRKAKQYLEEEGIKILDKHFILSALPEENEIKIVTNYIFSSFIAGDFGQVDILYPRNINLTTQEPCLKKFLPFNFANFNLENRNSAPLGFPVFEPGKKQAFTFLFDRYLEIIFAHYLYEARLAEFVARTVAMEHASSKVEEFISQLNLAYFKERRKFLTQKQLESFVPHKILK